MRTITVTCDRCGVEIHEGRALLKAESGRMRQALPELDLCGRCETALFVWLAAGPQDVMGDRKNGARGREDDTR